MNYELQFYKSIPIRLINRNHARFNAKRFVINDTNQNVWIPNKHLEDDGTIKNCENIDYVFRRSQRQLEIAGITQAIVGIKRASAKQEDTMEWLDMEQREVSDEREHKEDA